MQAGTAQQGTVKLRQGLRRMQRAADAAGNKIFQGDYLQNKDSPEQNAPGFREIICDSNSRNLRFSLIFRGTRIMIPGKALPAAVTVAHVFSLQTHTASWTYGICIPFGICSAFRYLSWMTIRHCFQDRQCGMPPSPIP